MTKFHMAALGAALILGCSSAGAETPVNIARDLPSVTVETEHGPAEISRIQDPEHRLTGDWARTSRPCPDFCIQPMQPAPGVTTIGELELLEMLQDPEALVIDSRTSDWFRQGTIPGAVSIPYTYIIDELGRLGCEVDFDGWDCAEAKPVALFCNGLWCGQSPTAIRNMLEAGYPAERIYYYRGGMQSWRLLGLTVSGGEDMAEEAEGLCNPSDYAALVGQNIAAVTLPAGEEIRVLREGQPATTDFNPARLNIETDEAGMVLRVFCG
ncbi:I78 family peptidase inhibitor [Salipiger abyssi]|uniref:Rhodanese-related sulfurtransferase n=1 Tax=Salipiger abyssi TaxID=1250539 RepID=A0A1P8UWU7_9RHOB|nr:Rhodanese-related sulfurtransferase [Salipiger abyssi]